MSEPHILVFLGTVGTGKSTQMRLLLSKLSEAGVRVTATSLKINHFLASILVVLLSKMLLNRRKDVYPLRAVIEKRPNIFKRLFKVWLALDLLSISLRFLLTIYLPTKIRYMVMVEEYIPATIADYIYIARIIGLPLKRLLFTVSFMLRLLHLGGSMITIFLDANNDTLKSRWNHRGSLNEKSDYLYMQRNLLMSISKKLSSTFLYVDTDNKTIEETHALIINYLRKF